MGDGGTAKRVQDFGADEKKDFYAHFLALNFLTY
jgi:hypothetical protein